MEESFFSPLVSQCLEALAVGGFDVKLLAGLG